MTRSGDIRRPASRSSRFNWPLFKPEILPETFAMLLLLILNEDQLLSLMGKTWKRVLMDHPYL
jgi:hypothetical protein